MRRILLLLIILGISSACLNINSTDLINSSVQLNASNCIYIEDLNTTINNSIVFQDNLRNISAGSNYTNSLNETYSCLFDKININQSLDYSENYTNTAHNITIRAPGYPLLNSLVRLDPGRTYYQKDLNLTVIANVLNQSAPTVPQFHKLNITQNISGGQWYNNSDVNISIYAIPFNKLNDTINLKCGENKEYTTLGITVNAPACATPIKRTLDYGEHLLVTDQGIDITAPPKLNKNLDLYVGQTDKEDNIGLTATCSINDTQLISMCEKQNDTQLVKLWDKISFNESQNCGAYTYVCVNNLTQYCSNDEKYSGRYGLINCFNRNIDEVRNQTKELTDQNTILTTQKAACETGQKQIQDDKDSSMTFVLMIITSMIILVCSIVLGIKWIKTQQIEQGGNMQ